MTWTLATASCVMGGVIALIFVPALLAPGFFRRAVMAFPRHTMAGWLLTAAALVWVTLIVLNAPLGRFEYLKPFLYGVAPAAFLITVFLVDELLAPRALGGLFLLAANPVLNIARWHDSPWRLVVTVLVYLMVIAGMILVLSPFRFRQFMGLWAHDPIRCRIGGALAVLLGGLLIVLSLTIY